MYIKKCDANIEQLKQKDCKYLTPQDIGVFIGFNPHGIRIIAKEDFERFGENRRFPFPVMRYGHRTKIERIPFIEWYEKSTS